jgi:hypothetical protein
MTVRSEFLSFLFWPLFYPPIVDVDCLCYTRGKHSVGLLWTSDRPVVEISTWQQTSLTRDRHPCPQLDSNPQSQQASGRRTHTLDRAATGIALVRVWCNQPKCVFDWRTQNYRLCKIIVEILWVAETKCGEGVLAFRRLGFPIMRTSDVLLWRKTCISLPLLGKNKKSLHINRQILRLDPGHVLPVFLGFSEDFMETL